MANYIDVKIVKTQPNSKCRLCGNKVLNVNHKVSECSNEHKRSTMLVMTRWEI